MCQNQLQQRSLIDGMKKLTNEELLALLLHRGMNEAEALALGEAVMATIEKIQQLRHVTMQELLQIKGIGKRRAQQLLAAVELSRRIGSKDDCIRYVIRSLEDAAAYVMEDLTGLQQEHFVVLYMNVKNQVIHKETVFIGSLNASIVHPREIFRHAIKRAAAHILLVHNHPSGSLSPSAEDLDVTERLVEVGKLVGIEVVDHLIIGDYDYLSFKEKGYIV